MRYNRLYFLTGIAVSFLLSFSSCGNHNETHENHNQSSETINHSEENHEGEAGEEHGHDHDSNEIELTADKAQRFGVTETEIVPSSFAEVLAVSGKIVPSPTDRSTATAKSSGIITLFSSAAEGKTVAKGQSLATISAKGMAGGDLNEAATIELNAAKRELDRATPLHNDGIISTRDFNEIKRRYEAALAVSSSNGGGGSSVTAPTSGVITQLLATQGQYVESGQPIANISGNNSLTLRADLPERNVKFLHDISGAKIRTSYSDETLDIAELGGKLMSAPSAATATGGYIPVYFNLSNNGALVNGAMCEVFLLGKEKADVITVPVKAVSEQQGNFFVYVKLSDSHYAKRAVKLGSNNGISYEVLSGLHPGEKVVTEGTTFVRLAESSGIVPEGHSHHH